MNLGLWTIDIWPATNIYITIFGSQIIENQSILSDIARY